MDRRFNRTADQDDLQKASSLYLSKYNPDVKVRARNLSDTMKDLLAITKNYTLIPGQKIS